MLKQDLLNNQQRIRHDWTLQESHIPRLNDVLIDIEQQLYVVKRAKGSIEKKLWLEDSNGNLIYEDVAMDGFYPATSSQEREFYQIYKKSKGWIVGNVFTIAGKDYPLILQDMEYDIMRRKMLYIFLDINSPDRKIFKTNKEELISFIPDHYYQIAFASFTEDSSSSLRYKTHVTVEDRGESYHEFGWSVSGGALEFGELEIALQEIDKIKNRMQIRRLASTLSKIQNTTLAELAINDNDEVYVIAHTHNVGQPGIFNSRVAAALALLVLGELRCKNALSYDIDTYLM